MRIALISSEFAGTAQGGGIGTYFRNLAEMLAGAGHDVEVFAGPEAQESDGRTGLRVHVVHGPQDSFGMQVVDAFAQRHRDLPFDVIEAPEFRAEALVLFRRFPEVPRVVKLHTASYQLMQMHHAYLPARAKLRYIAGALRRGRLPELFWQEGPSADDPEKMLALAADFIISPSQQLLEWTSQDWGLDAHRSGVLPNPFQPSDPATDEFVEDAKDRVLFVGKLEVRKGLIELAKAARQFLEEMPEARLALVGRAIPHPEDGRGLDTHVLKIAGQRCASRVELPGGIPYPQVQAWLQSSSVVVLPSYWEAFGYTCLEAMAAGRAVIGSSAGGMADIIEDGVSGILVPPRDPGAIASAVTSLLRDPDRRAELGEAARQRVISVYSPQAILPLQIAAYERAIANAQVRLGLFANA